MFPASDHELAVNPFPVWPEVPQAASSSRQIEKFSDPLLCDFQSVDLNLDLESPHIEAGAAQNHKFAAIGVSSLLDIDFPPGAIQRHRRILNRKKLRQHGRFRRTHLSFPIEPDMLAGSD
jgi:hypothetical protein